MSVDLRALTAVVKSKVPPNLSAGTDRFNVPANVTVMVPTTVTVDVVEYVTKQVHKLVPSAVTSTCKKAGIFGWLFFPCQITKELDVVENVVVPVTKQVLKTVDKATTIKTPLDVDVTHDIHLSDLNISMQGNKLQVDADLDFSLAIKADAKIVKVGLASCGVGEARPVVRLTEAALISWRPDGQLGIDKQPWSLTWPHPCNLTFADLPLETVLKLSGLEAMLDSVVDKKLSALPSSVDVVSRIGDVWKQLQVPRKLAGNVWLVLNPETASISNPVGEAGAIHFDVDVSCEPYVVYGDRPQIGATTPASLSHLHQGSAFSLELEGQASYSAGLALLNHEFANRDIQIEGHSVHITNIDMYPSGEYLVLGVGIKKPVKSRLWLFGKPQIDLDKGIVEVNDLDYSVETRHFLIKVADWILRSRLRDELRAKARLSIAPQMLRARAALANFEDIQVGVASVRVKVRDIGLAGPYLTADDAVIRLRVKGDAAVEVR